MLIKAVPQTYRGVRFRSTLEADWACTLDAYRISWQYEPEAVELTRIGEIYRPDFYLPAIRTWLEVKGPHDQRLGKPEELRWAVTCPPDCDQLLGHGIDHLGYRNPWRMVVIGRAAGTSEYRAADTLPASVPFVSTVFAPCTQCQHWQWTTWFHDEMCRFCFAIGSLDLQAEWAKKRGAQEIEIAHPKLHRAPRAGESAPWPSPARPGAK